LFGSAVSRVAVLFAVGKTKVTLAAPPAPLDFRIVALSEEMIVMLLWFSDDPLVGQNGAAERPLPRDWRDYPP
jgi:hypothetical protein